MEYIPYSFLNFFKSGDINHGYFDNFFIVNDHYSNIN